MSRPQDPLPGPDCPGPVVGLDHDAGQDSGAGRDQGGWPSVADGRGDGGPGDKPAAFLWRDLRLDGRSGTCAPPDLEVRPGELVLATHPDAEILRKLAGVASGQEAPAAGVVLWRGEKPPPEDNYHRRLGFYRGVARLGGNSRLLGGLTLLQIMCLELEYNRGLDGRQARAEVLGCLWELGLTRLADADPSELAGPGGRPALLALALIRRPGFFVFERPLSFLGPEFFPAAWRVVGRSAKRLGQGVLALDLQDADYPPGAFDRAAFDRAAFPGCPGLRPGPA
ncbi:MAG: hypothetical protein LBO05_07120 [Deltaproteobacteria bacterium]|nr:hypothetical protein [Deltaproteobacteria bacterium]